MSSLPPLAFGKVVGRFVANTADGPDIDRSPEFPPLSGMITFTAAARKVLVAQGEPDPATYVQLPSEYVASLDAFGYITWRGEPGIMLVAPNEHTNPTAFTYRVTFDLAYKGRRVTLDPFDIEVAEYIPGPDPDHPDIGAVGLVDLTLVSPVPPSAGTPIVRGLQGEGIHVDRRVATYAALPTTPAEGDGAQYVVAADHLLYTWRTGTGWMPEGQGTVIRGPIGLQGPQGLQGETGPQGEQGEQGEQGPPGADASTAWDDITDKPTTFPPVIGAGADQAVAGTDPRLTNPRTPTAAGQVYDFAYIHTTGVRSAGGGNVLPQGHKAIRPFRVLRAVWRGSTPDVSGSTVVELRRNGSALTGSSKTIAAADQTAGGAAATVTPSSGTWDYATGDVLLPYTVSVGTTPGQYWVCEIEAVTL